MSQGLHRQASARQDATEAGLAGASGMGLNFHTDLNIGSFPVVTVGRHQGINIKLPGDQNVSEFPSEKVVVISILLFFMLNLKYV